MNINDKTKGSNELHGGNIYMAAGKSGFNEREILDFSTNVNPLGVPDSLKKHIAGSLDTLASYPDPFCGSLRKALSQYVGVGEENIIAGNGAAEIIFLLFEVLKPENVLITAPSFAEYEMAAERAGSRIHFCNLKEEDGFRVSAGDIISRAEMMQKEHSLQKDHSLQKGCKFGKQMIFLCNPNNPTAKVIDPVELEKIFDYCVQRNIYLAVDETFIELIHSVPVRSLVREAASAPNLFVIRAFTKLFALPGLRIGYGAGNSELVSELWKRKLTWSVNSLAASAGEVLLQDREYLKRTEEWLAEEPVWFYRQLSEISGLKFYQPDTTFILGRSLNSALTAAEIKDKLLKQGILIRDCSNFRNLDAGFFRLAVKDRKSNRAFLEVFEKTIDKLQQAVK